MTDQTHTLELEVQGEGPLLTARVRELVEAVLQAGDVPGGTIEMGVAFVQPERMRELNAGHRGVDAATDVLSFPLDGVEPLAEGVPRQLGDVVVCATYVAEQVERGETIGGTGDTTLQAALERCVVHGVLHLVGHDHEVDEGAMFALEEQVLTAARRSS